MAKDFSPLLCHWLRLLFTCGFLNFVCVPLSHGAEILNVTVERDGHRYKLESITHFDAPRSDVYQALTDFDHLEDISKTIIESHYLEPEADGTPLIYTRVRACVLFYCKTVERVERLTFERPRYISTTAIAERSEVNYSLSEWVLTEDEDGGTQVAYSLEFEPGFWVPPLLGPIMIKRMLIQDGAAAVAKIEAMAGRAVSTDTEQTKD